MSNLDAANGSWQRVREHKVIQWGVGYFGAALALAHGAELVSHALHWPDVVWRVFVLALIVGFPIALTLAWYHGHKGFTQISAGELSIVSVLVLIGAVFFTVSLQPAEHASDVPAARPLPVSAGTRSVALPNSIAVLPFENRSPSPDDAYFAAGIHEQVINQLTKISALTVITRNAMLRYANTDLSIEQIARELNVAAVMQGSVRYADGNVRITTQLIDGGTAANIWSETYTRPFENIFAIETDIATQISAALQAELAPTEERSLAKRPTESADAYAYYLRALASVGASFGGLGVTLENAAEFHRHVDRALEIDSQFALAYAAKARDYAYSMGRLIPRSSGLSPEDRGTLAVANAERALELDPETGLAHAALATVHRFNWREREARLELERALALSPNDYQVLFDALVLDMYTGRYAAAQAYAERAARLNPVDEFLPLGLSAFWSGRYDEAATLYGARLEYDKRGSYLVAQTEALRGNTAAALQHLRDVEKLDAWQPPTTIAGVVYLYHRLGASSDAHRAAAKLEPFADEYGVGAGDWALVALSTGREAEALDWLARAAERKGPGPDWTSLNIIIKNLYSDNVLERPEFVTVRNRFAWR